MNECLCKLHVHQLLQKALYLVFYVPVCRSVYLSQCHSVCLSVGLSASMSFCLLLCLSLFCSRIYFVFLDPCLPNIFLSAMHVCLIAYIQARPQADRHTDRQAGRRTNKQTGCFLCYTVVKLCMFFFLISSSMLSESNKH